MTTTTLKPLTEVAGMMLGMPSALHPLITMDDIEALVRACRPNEECPHHGPLVDPEVAVPILRRRRLNPETGEPYPPRPTGFSRAAPEQVRRELEHHLCRLNWTLHQLGVWLPPESAQRARALLDTLDERQRTNVVSVATLHDTIYAHTVEHVLTETANDGHRYRPTRPDRMIHPDFDGDFDGHTIAVLVPTDYGEDLVDWIAAQVRED